MVRIVLTGDVLKVTSLFRLLLAKLIEIVVLKKFVQMESVKLRIFKFVENHVGSMSIVLRGNVLSLTDVQL